MSRRPRIVQLSKHRPQAQSGYGRQGQVVVRDGVAGREGEPLVTMVTGCEERRDRLQTVGAGGRITLKYQRSKKKIRGKLKKDQRRENHSKISKIKEKIKGNLRKFQRKIRRLNPYIRRAVQRMRTND